MLKMIVGYKKNHSQVVTKLSRSCIYHPTCSTYMFLSISRFGIINGLKLGMKRIAKCRADLYDGGRDQVPKSLF